MSTPLLTTKLYIPPARPGLVSRQAYLAYYKRAGPTRTRIWCEAIKANPMNRVTIKDDGHLEFHIWS